VALSGVRILDLSQLAPGPYCTMLLGDLGADVLVIENVRDAPSDGERRTAAHFALQRNKRSMRLNLKHPDGLKVFRALARDADVVVEGFRPGVVDRLGVGYDALRAENPRLVYCSISGYGQDGPYSQMAGHDLNYAAIAGVLGMTGRPGQPPAIPMNFLADYAGGSLMAAFSITAALFARERSGVGQYVDIAMSDGAMSLATKLAGQYEEKGVSPRPGVHRINGLMPYYDVYRCKDGGYLAVGPLEAKFYANLCRALALPQFESFQHDESKHDEIRAAFEQRFLEKPRDAWFAELRDAEACVTPVYSIEEAMRDPHNVHRRMAADVDNDEFGALNEIGVAPKLSATPGSLRTAPPAPGEHTDQALGEAGYSADEIERLRSERVVS
jgi:crotonobetainyl-CoA:carnitine CoA-transferase CaiB-like acyl-CoA transferase